jgi:hypothetical protein
MAQVYDLVALPRLRAVCVGGVVTVERHRPVGVTHVVGVLTVIADDLLDVVWTRVGDGAVTVTLNIRGSPTTGTVTAREASIAPSLAPLTVFRRTVLAILALTARLIAVTTWHSAILLT